MSLNESDTKVKEEGMEFVNFVDVGTDVVTPVHIKSEVDVGDCFVEEYQGENGNSSDSSADIAEVTNTDEGDGAAPGASDAKRKRKSKQIILLDETERQLGEWLQYHVPYIYDKRDSRHKDKDHIDSLWASKAASLQPPISAGELKQWFTSLRSRFGRLSKENPDFRRFTDRERWIMNLFGFLKPHIKRHQKPRSYVIFERAKVREALPPAPSIHITSAPQTVSRDGSDESSLSEDDELAVITQEKSKPKAPKLTIENFQEISQSNWREDEHLRHWKQLLESLAVSAVALPKDYWTALKFELNACVHRFTVAQRRGVIDPDPDLLLHVNASVHDATSKPRSQPRQIRPRPPPLPQATPIPTLLPTDVQPTLQQQQPPVLVSLNPQQLAHFHAYMKSVSSNPAPSPAPSLPQVDSTQMTNTNISLLGTPSSTTQLLSTPVQSYSNSTCPINTLDTFKKSGP